MRPSQQDLVAEAVQRLTVQFQRIGIYPSTIDSVEEGAVVLVGCDIDLTLACEAAWFQAVLS